MGLGNLSAASLGPLIINETYDGISDSTKAIASGQNIHDQTALLIIAMAFLSKKNGRASWKTALREHAKTESPNAGWPMAAMAGALNVQLEKTGQYKLGNSGAPPAPETIDASLELVQWTILAWVSICLIAGVICFVITT